MKTINLDGMIHKTAERINHIENFEEKLEQLKKDNSLVKRVIKDKWKGLFEDIWDRLQNLVIDQILWNKN